MIEIHLSTQSYATAHVDLLLVLTQNTNKQGTLRELDRHLDGHLFELIQHDDFKANEGQRLLCTTWGRIQAPRLMLFGLGEDFNDSMLEWRQAVAEAIRAASSEKPTSIGVVLNGRSGDLSATVEGLTLGATLVGYRFDHYKKPDSPSSNLESVTYFLPSRSSAAVKKSAQQSLKRALVLAESICAARDLVNAPPNELTPTEFAVRAEEMAENVGLTCNVHGPDQLREWGMNLFLAVSSGSVEEPRLIHLIYKPKGRRKKKDDKRVVAFVGKGVTFDSGGLSLKPTSGMLGMQADMAGAAAVFGAMQAIAQLKPSVEVHGYIGATENMTGAAAYRINDVILGHNKTSVEIKNTDAEGRLVLADTLSYAVEQGATEVIDLATLTGACLVALGQWTAGLMSDRQEMADAVLRAASQVGEDLWQLPLPKPLRAQLKSSVADISNVGGRFGGAITAGMFLREFVSEEVDWSHIDLAGPSFVDKDLHHMKKGGTGYGVATLVQYAMQETKP